MINQELEIFLRFDLPQNFRQKFYPDLFKYFDFVYPLIKKHKHNQKNEMECVGSQYLHLSYLEHDERTSFLILRNEQGRDIVFQNYQSSFSRNLKVFIAHSENSFEERLPKSHHHKETKNGINLNFKDLNDVRQFLSSYSGEASITNKTAEILKKERRSKKTYDPKLSVKELIDDIFKETKKKGDKEKPRSKPIINLNQIEETFHPYSCDGYTFQEEMEIFQLSNTMLCGVTENLNLKFPDQFFNNEVADFVKTLTKVVK